MRETQRDATRCAGGDEAFHALAHPHPGEEGGVDPGGYPPVLHPRRERGTTVLLLS